MMSLPKQFALALVLTGFASIAAHAGFKPKSALQTREEYLSRVQQQQATSPLLTTTGSLWTSGGALTDLSTDYKASHVNDTIIIQIVQETVSEATGATTTGRDVAASSAITNLPGKLNVGGVNPLLGATSSTSLKGTGATSSTSKLQTSLSGQVIAVLPNGNLVVEAQRAVLLNHEKETAIVRGIVRPGDIAPNNIVLSTSLSDLEIELKGKGVVTDATRPPSIVMKILTRLLTF
jgi:flagellar L-ring protein precursor FlgH